jgi:hypothetical protein
MSHKILIESEQFGLDMLINIFNNIGVTSYKVHMSIKEAKRIFLRNGIDVQINRASYNKRLFFFSIDCSEDYCNLDEIEGVISTRNKLLSFIGVKLKFKLFIETDYSDYDDYE